MIEKTHKTDLGVIHYWLHQCPKPNAKTICFLPGLTLDNTLFAPQVAYFSAHYNVLVWDAPAHGKSRPFSLNFSLEDLARFLHEIFTAENIKNPILVGHSLGGYIAQMYMELYPEEVSHFVSIGSVSLQRKYFQKSEILFFKYGDMLYRWFPWPWLIKIGMYANSKSEDGKEHMKQTLSAYNKKEYCHLAGFGSKMIAKAIEKNYPYRITCPTLLIYGQYDNAPTKRLNKTWAENTGFSPVEIIGAGHNSNRDEPEKVNKTIENFISVVSHDS